MIINRSDELFEKDSKPLLYILDNKNNNILTKTKQKTSLTLFTNIPEIKIQVNNSNPIIAKLKDPNYYALPPII